MYTSKSWHGDWAPRFWKNEKKRWGSEKRKNYGKGGKIRKNAIFRVEGPKFGPPMGSLPADFGPCQPVFTRIFSFNQEAGGKLTSAPPTCGASEFYCGNWIKEKFRSRICRQWSVAWRLNLSWNLDFQFIDLIIQVALEGLRVSIPPGIGRNMSASDQFVSQRRAGQTARFLSSFANFRKNGSLSKIFAAFVENVSSNVVIN